MKELVIDRTRVRELITYDSENYFISEVFKNLANEIARENNIDINIAKIILAFDTMEAYRWIEISTTRIIFYIDNENADVYNIGDKMISRYENGRKYEEADIEDYLRWSAYRKEVMSR